MLKLMAKILDVGGPECCMIRLYLDGVLQNGAVSVSVKQADELVDVLNGAVGMREALQEITRGEGAFSRDPLKHAENTIESLMAIAEAALPKAKGGKT